MKMRKAAVFAVMMALVLCLALTACSGGNDTPPEGDVPPAGDKATFELDGLRYESIEGYEGCVTLLGPTDKGITALTVPAEVNGNRVMRIADRAFADCTSLKTVKLEASVEDSADRVFAGCTALESVTAMANVGVNWFEGCTSLTELSGNGRMLSSIYLYCVQQMSPFYETAQQITKMTVYDLDERYPIHDLSALERVEFVGETTAYPSFSKCIALEEMTVPEGVTELRVAFDNCSSLREITLPSTLRSVYAFVARNCPIERVNVSDVSSYLQVSLEYEQNLSSGGIFGCSGYDMLTLGEELTELTLPASSSGISYLFEGCASLRELTVEDGITEIGTRAFRRCSNLVILELPDSVTSIGAQAFGDVELARLTVGTGLSSLGDGAFSTNVLEVYDLCPLELSEYFTGAYAIHTSLDEQNHIYVIDGAIIHKTPTFGIGSMLRYIGEGGDVVLPTDDDIPGYTIETGAFGGRTDITSVSIPPCVKSIAQAAFSNSSIECIYISGGETTVHYNAFSQMRRLWDVYSASELNAGISSVNPFVRHSDFSEPRAVEVNEDGLAFVRVGDRPYLVFYRGNGGTVSLPESYEGEKYGIWTYALSYIGRPDAVIIPNGAVCEIQVNALLTSHCTTYNYGYYIGEWLYASYNSPDGEGRITVKDGTVGIADNAYSATGWSYEVLLPDSLKYIGYRAFKSGGFTVAIPDGVEYIGAEAFAGEGGRSNNVTLPSVLPHVGNRAFESAEISGVVILDGGTTLGDYVFGDATLSELVLRKGAVLSAAASRGVQAQTLRIEEGALFTNEDELSGYYYNSRLKNVYVKSLSVWLDFAKEYARLSPAYTGVKLHVDGAEVSRITLPSELTVLEQNAFCGIALTEIDIPESISEIKTGALLATGLTSITGGEGVSAVEYGAVSSLDLVESYVYGNINYKFNTATAPVSCDITWAMPKAGTSLSDRFFEGCTRLSQVFVPLGCALGDNVFVNVSYEFTVIFEDEAPEGSAWKSVELNGNSYRLGSFYEELGEYGSTYGTVSTYMGYEGGFAYKRTENNTAEIIGYFGGSSTPTVPSSLGGRTVVAISDLAFHDRTDLTGITLGEGIKRIGVRAFEGCTSLVEASLPESISMIYSLAFNECTSLNSVSVTGGGYFAAATVDTSGNPVVVTTVDGSDGEAFAKALSEYAAYTFGRVDVSE